MRVNKQPIKLSKVEKEQGVMWMLILYSQILLFLTQLSCIVHLL